MDPRRSAVRRRLLLGSFCLFIVLSLGWLAKGGSGRPMHFVDHGVASAVSESRGVVATQDSAGNRLILALSMDRLSGTGGTLRTSLLVIDVETGETEQYWYPAPERASGPTYALIKASTGRLYLTLGSQFLEFDVDGRAWTFAQAAGEAMSFTEGPDGTIYFATYPTSTLFSFDPRTRVLVNHGRLDPQEQYPNSLRVDDTGWVYAGIGTARSNLVAYHPATKELRQLVSEAERRVGTGTVFLGRDGQVYGRAFDGGTTYRLSGGAATPGVALPATDAGGGISWGSIVRNFDDGSRLLSFDLPGRKAQIADATGRVTEITFNYVSEGTQITSLVAGPDGRIYGSTSHPMHWFVYDPAHNTLEDWGPIERIGGGNFGGLAAQGDVVVGAAYSGGHLYAFDVTKPWDTAPGLRANPRLLAEYPGPITRPRAVLAHPDGRHIVVGGFAGYGLVGGGLAIYDLERDQSLLLNNPQLIPGHSTITLRALPNGDLIGGTSVEAPGGGQPTATEGKLFIFDWTTREIVFQTEPIPARSVFGTARLPGAREVVSLEIAPSGFVYGLASGARFFVFDPMTREVIHRGDFGAYGAPARADQSFVRTESGDVYALLSQGILRVDPVTYGYEVVAVPPQEITAGLGLHDGILYFASGTHLWSVRLEAGS